MAPKTESAAASQLAVALLGNALSEFANFLAKKWEVEDPNLAELISEFTGEIKKGGTSTRKQKKKKDPDAPKRPSTSYIFFCNEQRSKLKEEGLDFKEIGKRLGEMWKALSDKKKKKYEKMAEDDKKRYEKAIEDYNPPGDQEVEKKPSSGGKKKSPEDNVSNGRQKAIDKSGDDTYCYNVNTGRVVKFDPNKTGDKYWDATNHLVSSSQDELDEWLEKLGLDAEECD